MPTASDYGVESVEEIITGLYGLSGEHRGLEFDMVCPNPKHIDNSPSCSVNLFSGYWNCFSCGAGGDLLALGQLVLNRDAQSVSELLKPSTPEAMLVAVQRRIAKMTYSRPVKKKSIELPEYPSLHSHPDLTKRLFTDEQIEKWEMGWVEEQEFIGNKGQYVIKNSIAIPIKSAEGKNLAWCYRSTSSSPSWQPRYLYTPGIEISEIWFGLQHHHNVDHVVIVEGALDAMWLDQCGFPALALLGSKMGDRKIRWLQSFSSITLMPDRDQAGAIWQSRVTDMIGLRMPIYLAQYRTFMLKKTPEPDGTWRRAADPEELRAIDLEIMMASKRFFISDKVNKTVRH